MTNTKSPGRRHGDAIANFKNVASCLDELASAFSTTGNATMADHLTGASNRILDAIVESKQAFGELFAGRNPATRVDEASANVVTAVLAGLEMGGRGD